MKVITKIAGLAMASLMIAGVAVAESPHDGAVKARQGLMRIYVHNLGQLGAMAKGAVEYDAKVAATAAKNLMIATTIDQSAMWPQGSDSTALGDKTGAKLEIWSTFPDVAEKDKAMKAAAAAIADAAGKDLASLQGAIGDVGKACGSCHKPFRVKKN